MIYSLIFLAIGSYFLGNINWALIISKLKKNDIRKLGSGNPGTLNMSRNFGLKIGLLTFFLDILKGAIPTLVSFLIFNGKYFEISGFSISVFAMYLTGFCAVLGHIYPVVLKFKGGKGIASTIGVLLVCEITSGWVWTVVCIMALVAAGLFIYFTEFGAMGSFIAITPPAVFGAIRLFVFNNAYPQRVVFLFVTSMLIFFICFFTWFAHRKNIERMLAGEEHPTSIKKMFLNSKLKKIDAKSKKEEMMSIKSQVDKTINGE